MNTVTNHMRICLLRRDISKLGNQDILQADIHYAQIQAAVSMEKQVALYGIALCAGES